MLFFLHSIAQHTDAVCACVCVYVCGVSAYLVPSSNCLRRRTSLAHSPPDTTYKRQCTQVNTGPNVRIVDRTLAQYSDGPHSEQSCGLLVTLNDVTTVVVSEAFHHYSRLCAAQFH